MKPGRDRYLILDNSLNRFWLPEGLLTHRVLSQPAELYHAAKGHFPESLAPYRGVVLTGSIANVTENRHWYQREEALLKECLDGDIPILGICFGAQFLCSVVWGHDTLECLEFPEMGWVHIYPDRDNVLFSGLPARITMFSGHYWGCRPPSPSLAESDTWEQQAFQVPGARAWGIQFHPEIGWLYGNLFLQYVRLKEPGLRLHRQGRPSARHALALLRNFSSICEQ